MNRENAKDYLPLVQALAEGKVIQYFPDESEGWIDCDEVNFMIDVNRFRIKSEPKEVWINRHIDGRNSHAAYESKAGAEAGMMDGWFSVRYREVIE
jgi:hypothetical protein